MDLLVIKNYALRCVVGARRNMSYSLKEVQHVRIYNNKR